MKRFILTFVVGGKNFYGDSYACAEIYSEKLTGTLYDKCVKNILSGKKNIDWCFLINVYELED